jgi:ABC-type Fe3+-siderophore transport system permease subunit
VPALWLASGLVLAAALLASFRQGFAADLETLLVANGARVLFGAAAGAAFALAGAVRLVEGRAHALDGLRFFAASAGAASGAYLGASGLLGAAAWLGASLGGVGGAAVGLGLARAADRASRAANLAAAGVLGMGVAAAALAGSYARERQDALGSVVAWLLGDLSGATAASGVGLAAVVFAAAALVIRDLRRPGARAHAAAGLAWGVGLGAAGLLAFAASLVPRVVRGIVGAVPAPTFVATCAGAGAATVVAVDAVTRLLVGGYDFPFNVPAAMVAAPVFLVWNRSRLRALVGRRGFAFEAAEVTAVVAFVVLGTALAAFLASVIASAT